MAENQAKRDSVIRYKLPSASATGTPPSPFAQVCRPMLSRSSEIKILTVHYTSLSRSKTLATLLAPRLPRLSRIRSGSRRSDSPASLHPHLGLPRRLQQRRRPPRPNPPSPRSASRRSVKRLPLKVRSANQPNQHSASQHLGSRHSVSHLLRRVRLGSLPSGSPRLGNLRLVSHSSSRSNSNSRSRSRSSSHSSSSNHSHKHSSHSSHSRVRSERLAYLEERSQSRLSARQLSASPHLARHHWVAILQVPLQQLLLHSPIRRPRQTRLEATPKLNNKHPPRLQIHSANLSSSRKSLPPHSVNPAPSSSHSSQQRL